MFNSTTLPFAAKGGLAVAEQMIAFYNAQDVDAYVGLMSDNAVEAGYSGNVLRDGKEGIRNGLKAMFTEFPQNRAEILSGHVLGEFVVLHEKVFRSPGADAFEVMSIYSFEGDKVSRVEFVR
ncbi:MAG: nuclear transport factor 2 family protein [Sphingorhabdus sp.]